MSTVNRNSNKIQQYTQNTQEVSLSSMEKNLSSLKEKLNDFEIDGAVDPNVKDTLNRVKEDIDIILKNVRRLQVINDFLATESRELIAIGGNDFIRINTDQVRTGLAGALLSVDGFCNAVMHYVDFYTMGIKERIIQGSMVEFRTKVSAKRNELDLQKKRLEMSGTENPADLQKIAQLTAKIDRLNRCLAAADTYEKRLHMICLELREIQNEAYAIAEQIRTINMHASDKVQAIEKTVKK